MSASVLIVDDDVNARIISETLLRLRGLRVLSANDDTEALELIRQGDIGVVVLDLGTNGLDLLRRIRCFAQRYGRPVQPRIVVVTHHKEPEAERFAQRLGADAFLHKPLVPAQLIATVEDLALTSPLPAALA